MTSITISNQENDHLENSMKKTQKNDSIENDCKSETEKNKSSLHLLTTELSLVNTMDVVKYILMEMMEKIIQTSKEITIHPVEGEYVNKNELDVPTTLSIDSVIKEKHSSLTTLVEGKTDSLQLSIESNFTLNNQNETNTTEITYLMGKRKEPTIENDVNDVKCIHQSKRRSLTCTCDYPKLESSSSLVDFIENNGKNDSESINNSKKNVYEIESKESKLISSPSNSKDKNKDSNINTNNVFSTPVPNIKLFVDGNDSDSKLQTDGSSIHKKSPSPLSTSSKLQLTFQGQNSKTLDTDDKKQSLDNIFTNNDKTNPYSQSSLSQRVNKKSDDHDIPSSTINVELFPLSSIIHRNHSPSTSSGQISSTTSIKNRIRTRTRARAKAREVVNTVNTIKVNKVNKLLKYIPGPNSSSIPPPPKLAIPTIHQIKPPSLIVPKATYSRSSSIPALTIPKSTTIRNPIRHDNHNDVSINVDIDKVLNSSPSTQQQGRRYNSHRVVYISEYDYNMYSQISLEDIARGPPCMITPMNIQFSPNGTVLSFLYPDERGLQQLFTVNLSSNVLDKTPQKLITVDTSDHLSLEEQLRRERMRLFTSGLTSYEWDKSRKSDESTRIMIPLDGKIAIYDETASNQVKGKYTSSNSSFRLVYDNTSDHSKEGNTDILTSKQTLPILSIPTLTGSAMVPILSPDGKKIAFVVNKDIYILYLEENNLILRVTKDGEKDGFSCGLADFLAQEEMNRFEAMWWSPDSNWLSFTLVDESHIPKFSIKHTGDEDPYKEELHRYPFAGKENPIVKLAYVSIPSIISTYKSAISTTPIIEQNTIIGQITNEIKILDLMIGSGRESWKNDYYIVRSGWWPDNSISVQVQNRSQNILQLLRVDPMTGQLETFIEEISDDYVNPHDLLWSLETGSNGNSNSDGFDFLWGSERSGYQQLYFYHYDNVKKTVNIMNNGHPIGGGDSYVIERIADVDEINGFVYVVCNYSNPILKQLCRLCLTSNSSHSESTQVIVCGKTDQGWHNAYVNVKAGICVDIFSSIDQSPRTYLISLPSTSSDSSSMSSEILLLDSKDINTIRSDRLIKLLSTPVIQSIKSKDGSVDIYYSIRYPKTIMKSIPMPAIVSVYGGPHVQYCANQWSHRASLREQYYSDLGYAIIRIDNRGSDRRGHVFEAALFKHMGTVEVEDYVTVIEYLISIDVLDGTRIGIMGWSYGGYISLMAMARAPHIFKCCVSGAPVTSWDGYDTYYTEKYMSHPNTNAEGYKDSSVMTHVQNIQGKLMIIHGLIDENVHFRHTSRLLSSLVNNNKSYELLLLPDERHGPRQLPTRVFLEEQILQFFQNHLPISTTRFDSSIDFLSTSSGTTGGTSTIAMDSNPIVSPAKSHL